MVNGSRYDPDFLKVNKTKDLIPVSMEEFLKVAGLWHIDPETGEGEGLDPTALYDLDKDTRKMIKFFLYRIVDLKGQEKWWNEQTSKGTKAVLREMRPNFTANIEWLQRQIKVEMGDAAFKGYEMARDQFFKTTKGKTRTPPAAKNGGGT